MNLKNFTIALLATVICSALYVSINNTIKSASDFNALVLLVSIPDQERSYNPYSQDFFWVSQDTAVFLIKEFQYPYKNCSKLSQRLGACHEPRIEYASRFIGFVDPSTEIKIMDVIRYLIEKGEPINAYSSKGYTALQTAIFSHNLNLISILLKAGADPYLPINIDSDKAGMNSFEFVDALSVDNEVEYSQIKDVLQDYSIN